uniref:Glycosyltransferase family 92 protein n=1 Tax=Panagrellus redivivus TaxID=6233 RepID=A0A7E4W4Y2_PANRE
MPSSHFSTVNLTITIARNLYLTVSTPNKKPYKFVACMSRMVAVDDWAMVIFAMEAFRYFGGDLAVAPVECAIKEVMKLLRLYEKDGILKIQPAFKPRQIRELFYNTNQQTEYSNQISNSHECFYEFKESAEFISFPDWDDILMGYRQDSRFSTYYDMFAPLIQQYPNAAAFSLNRYHTALLTPVHELVNFSLANVLRKAVYSKTSVVPKMVIRPKLVASCWIHTSKVMENDTYFEMQTSAASFAHLNYALLTKHNATVKPGNSKSSFLDPDVLDSTFRSMLKRHSFVFENANFPFVSSFRGLISSCYRKITKDFVEDGLIYCPSIASCKYKTQNVAVEKSKTTYKEQVTAGPFLWIERKDSYFIADNKGCL